MWNELPVDEKKEYKKMILAFASLTEMFAQKSENDNKNEKLSPIINSKYQETVFQRVFHASAEDIGNTSYDAAIDHIKEDGTEIKYLIGIKTFGITSGAQKIAQFKANHNEWSGIINQMRQNGKNEDGNIREKDEINHLNLELYKDLAKKIAELRNERIRSSEANLKGFNISKGEDQVEAVYHVLMPSKKGDDPAIYVGETQYNQIDIDNIEILGCTGSKNPTNFSFSDGNHTYRFTAADSQLLMDFNNNRIIQEQWDVMYADDAYKLFANLADQIYGDEKEESVIESYSWKITKKGKVEKFSGFNSFYGVGSKMGKDQREKRIQKIREKYEEEIQENLLNQILDGLTKFFFESASTDDAKQEKVNLRKNILKYVHETKNKGLIDEITKLVYRPETEMYIPIKNARKFHEAHPDFFGKDIGRLKDNSDQLLLEKEKRKFDLIFEPSGDKIESFITQDCGKAIESYEKQTYLGEWILRGIFQLEKYEPLTEQKLNDIGINGIRLYKINGKNEIHLQFIWIDDDNIPDDYIGEQ